MWAFVHAAFHVSLLSSSTHLADEFACEANEVTDWSFLQVRASRGWAASSGASKHSPLIFYVSPSGSDAMGDGLRDNPYRTIFGTLRHHKESLTEHGGIIYLRGGMHRWAEGEGRIEGIKFGGKGLLIASDLDDSHTAVLSSAIEINRSSWRQRSNGQWNQEKVQEDTHVWCSTLPSKIEGGVQAAVWLDYGNGLQLAHHAKSPDIKYEIDVVDWPFTALMSDLVIPQSDHAFSDNLLQGSSPVKLSVPPWCKHNCDSACQAAFGGPGCPGAIHLPDCGLNTAWLHDEERFGDESKNFTGGFLDIGLCSSKSILKYLPIVAHDRHGGRVQFDYSRYACDPDEPTKQTHMWQGDDSCWKDHKLTSEDRPRYRIYSEAEQDRENEWFIMPHDSTSMPEVCIRLRSSPATIEGPAVHVRMRGPTLDFIGSENIHVDNVHFFASEMRNSVNEDAGLGKNIIFERAVVSYPGKIFLGPATLLDAELRFGEGISFSGWMGSSHPPAPCRMQNTLLEYSWNGVELWDCAGGIVTSNTIQKIQNGNGLQINFRKDRGSAVEDYIGTSGIEVSFNRISDIGFSELSDGSGLQSRSSTGKKIQHHNNWIYQMPAHRGMQLEAGESGGDFFQNVFWNTAKGLVAKGGVHERNLIVHNTGFQNRDCDFVVPKNDYGRRCNEKSEVFNNAGNDWRDSSPAHCSQPVCTEPCKSGSNSVHFDICTKDWQRVQDMLRDVSVFDFRPHQDANITGVANKRFSKFAPGVGVEGTIGAYEANGTHYTIPGRVLLRSSSPIPPDGFPSASYTQDLIWNHGSKAVAHDVYLGMSYCAVFGADREDHSLLVGRFAWPINIVSNGTLEMGSTYYWRVDAVVKDGIVKGEVWCFRVTETGERSLDSPWNFVTGIDRCASSIPSSCLHGSDIEPEPPKVNYSQNTTIIDWQKTCSSMSQQAQCTNGEVYLFPLKVLTSAACIDLCSAYPWIGLACCTWRMDGLCRVHIGRFSIREASDEWYVSECSGIDILSTTTTTTTSYILRPQCSNMLSNHVCVEGEVEMLGNASSAQACHSLCETMTTATSNCCVWFSIAETCRLHSGIFKRYAKDHFYAADCSEDAVL